MEIKYDYCFKFKGGYTPIASSHIVNQNFVIKKGNNSVKINSFEVQHGLIKATAYIVNKIAYLSDCNYISSKSKKNLFNLEYLIVDCLRYKFHPSHFNFEAVINLVKEIKPKKTILTNLHVELDYNKLKKKLPPNIMPAFDGMNFSF